MKNSKKIKFFLVAIYTIVLITFLTILFSKFSFNEIKSYDFIKSYSDIFEELKSSNLYGVFIISVLLIVFWVLMAGFMSPVAIVSGFVFGKWIGTICVVMGGTIGATLLYLISKYVLYEFIKEKFSKKYQNLEKKFKKNEFIYVIIYRMIGGIPFVIQNILPVIFNVKLKNYFFGTFIGITPQLFIIVSLGSGIEKVIDMNDKAPGLINLITQPDIYLPILAFVFFIILTFLFKKFKNNPN
tara:strand:+ start:4361 stop:5083 length:723 start_codon:yes stop_codon:yes gene_type:complete